MLQMLENYLLWSQDQAPLLSIDTQEERKRILQFQEFYNPLEEQFDRNHLPGHFTGSALIVNHDFSKVLLTLHAKLNLWLQLGGHADGDKDLAAVAFREAQEESGLDTFFFVDLENFDLVDEKNKKELMPFDIDCHLIPQTKNEQQHYHYDIAFLLIADESLPLHITPESKALQWFTLEEAKIIATEERLQRMFCKVESVKKYKGHAAILS